MNEIWYECSRCRRTCVTGPLKIPVCGRCAGELLSRLVEIRDRWRGVDEEDVEWMIQELSRLL